MPINASLFAHIQNDAFLSGTYGLEGHFFRHTTKYLSDYLNRLHHTGKTMSPKYLELMKNMDYLVLIEQGMQAAPADKDRATAHMDILASDVADKLQTLSADDKTLFIPGGWFDEKGGHSMVYQFTREADHYVFTAINSGDGIRFHAKKSAKDKELYNPTKSWSIPVPTTSKEKQEVAHFISRLLKARLLNKDSAQASMSSKKLYEETLTSISYVNGTEIDTSATFPDFAYTAGQLSGTCSQRSLHQLLKINSDSLEQYQRFIFEFKMHALQEYADLCFKGSQPFNAGVADQIKLSIENNLKILNTQRLFDEHTQQHYLRELKTLQANLKKQAIALKVKAPSAAVYSSLTTFLTDPIAAPRVGSSAYNYILPPAINIDFRTGAFLNKLEEHVAKIESLRDPAAQCVYLEQLLLALPISVDGSFISPPYTELSSLYDYQRFCSAIEKMQGVIVTLQKTWVKDTQLSKLNILALSALTLQTDATNVINTKQRLPSYKPYTDLVMQSILANNLRNPYWASNNPKIDERLLSLQTRFSKQNLLYSDSLYPYFNQVLDTEPVLKEELKLLYQGLYNTNITKLHTELRAHNLQALFMISLHINGTKLLDARFDPIINKIREVIDYEVKIRRAINPLFITQYSEHSFMNFDEVSFRILTPLYPTYVPYEDFSDTITKHKYALKPSFAKDALEADLPKRSAYSKKLNVRSANYIQLHPETDSENPSTQLVTQNDIIARDYFHLRANPELQIGLTLDYFKRNIDKLSEESNQRYVEANLFQPGLLLKAIKDKHFFPQFDSFLATGLRFFTKSGLHNQESLLYIRLDFLVSRYLLLSGDNREGLKRIENMQKELIKQLEQTRDPKIIYVLQQYLFLCTSAKIESGNLARDDRELALSSYLYMQSHTNPCILEDTTHRTEVECAINHFQMYMGQQTSLSLRDSIAKIIISDKYPETKGLRLTGTYPVYKLEDTFGMTVYTFNAVLGKLFDHNMAKSGLPLAIKNHPLLKHLGLEQREECLMTADGTYMVLPHPQQETRLFYNANRLVVQQDWSIEGTKAAYELQALTYQHMAWKANNNIGAVYTSYPKILLDGSMDYWKSTTAEEGILVQNNIPRYLIKRTGEIFVLDDKGLKTPYQLKQLDAAWAPLLTEFESEQFILHHESIDATQIKLPRFNLSFLRDRGLLINTETGEQVVDSPSPIHPKVAGLSLSKGKHQRYIVPVERFYASTHEAEDSELYPVTHDTTGTIAQSVLEQQWKNQPPLNKPLWHHENSKKHVSFLLKDGVPIADTPADALYLAYIYLATNQTQKAWDTLEDCKTRLGGLTGSPEELQYLSWICNEVPHILHEQTKDTQKAVRKTPPYVACQGKALSIACDFLSQDNTFKLTPPVLDNTANSYYLKLQHEQQASFLSTLPDTIYKSFTRLQAMRRHLESTYTLSTIERKRLLNYYQAQTQSDAPKGALGYEWMQLTLETLQEEHQSLLALRTSGALSAADTQRLKQIEKHFKTLKPVLARSTELQLVAIDLSIPAGHKLQQNHLKRETKEAIKEWSTKLPGVAQSSDALDRALALLSSNISDDILLANFPAFLQIAQGNSARQTKILMDFCTKTLLAERHIPMQSQESNKVFICNILYRVAHNKPSLSYLGASFFSFTRLVDTCRTALAPALRVYEAVDVHKTILATPEAILSQQKPAKPTPLKSPVATYIPLVQYIKEGTALAPFIKQNNKLNQDLDASNTGLAERLDDNAEEAMLLEVQAGKNQLLVEQQQIILAQTLLDDPAAMRQLNELVESIAPETQGLVDGFWLEALELANRGPADPALARQWEIERTAKARKTLTQADLYSLYTRADLSYSIAQTGLSPENAQKLHELTHNALVNGIKNSMLASIKEGLKKATLTRNVRALIPVLDLVSKKEIPALTDPSIVLLQHEEEIVLRPRQVTALKTLLERPEAGKPFRESVEKIIPGGGKSKVILPILAEQKAQGDNLVIVEVPQALLATNHVDLNRISQRLFGKSAYRFEFNRDSNSSSERLEQLYNHFIEIMTTRGYLVSAGESIQSLELKYLELLLTEGDKNEEWQKQVFWCDKIVNLIRNRGDVIIDEVHQGLWIKKKLNYTVGAPKPLPPATIQNAIALFQYIDDDFIAQAPTLSEDYDWTVFKTDLALKLLTDSNSPLHGFVSRAKLRYGAGAERELLAYLISSAKSMPEVVVHASPEMKSSLAFFKQEISVLLPQTLVRRLDEKYGASKRAHLSPIERTLAIPYAANNIPNERSRFGNNIEAINCTCQMMLLKGVSKELLVEQLGLWLALARQELFQNPSLANLDQTPTGQGFALQWAKLGINLSQIQLDNAEQISILHGHLKNNRTLIFDMLQQQSLKLIHRDNSIIHSDSFNHIDLYRTAQGVSGTPSNHTTYHKRLEYDKKSSLGTDGYIVELLRTKKTTVGHLDYKNIAQFINETLTGSTARARCRAIIDIRASFQGVNNLQVAQELAKYIRANSAQFSTAIKHVLYFNEEQVLCAIDVTKPEKPIVLKSSDVDEVNRLLGTTPDERFTYYDQVRTLGTDITQDEQAHAIVLADEKTSLQAFLQGSMRMRGLSQNQTIEIITPESLKGTTRDELFTRFAKNDQRSLLADNLFAAKANMTNLMRRSCLSLVQKIASDQATEKAALAQHLKSFFISNPSNDLFELYGALNKKQATAEILERYRQQVLVLWQSALKSAKITVAEEETAQISEELGEIITKALPNCQEEYESGNDAFAVEVEVQKEVEKEMETQVLTINQQYDPALIEKTAVNWNDYRYYFSTLFVTGHNQSQVSHSLNTVCSTPVKRADLFSDKLRASKSYAYAHTKQTQCVDAFLKPVLLTWYHYEGKELHAMIITPQDAEGLKAHIETTPGNWLATTQDTVLCGTRPDKTLEDANYQALREQIRFFNGEFRSLLNPEAPLCWLNEKPLEKINFFEERLLPYRPGCAPLIQELKTILTQSNTEGFTYITEHPFEDLTDFNWLDLYPETSTAQADVYKKLAMAFHYIHENWLRGLDLTDLQQRFRLPLNSLGYVKDHLEYLSKLTSLIRNIAVPHPHAPLLFDLGPAEQIALEQCLGMPLTAFYEANGIKKNTHIGAPSDKLELIYVKALQILRTHPAIQDKTEIDNILLIFAKRTFSTAVLAELVKTEKPSDLLVMSLINHRQHDSSITDALLENVSINLTAKALEQLATKCATETQIQSLIRKKGITDQAVSTLLSKRLSKAILLEILPLVKSETTLMQIYLNAGVDKEIREKLYTNPLFSPLILSTLLQDKKVPEEELIQLINSRNKAIDNSTLTTAVTNPACSTAVLSAIVVVTHIRVDVSISKKIIEHKSCSPEVINTLMDLKGHYLETELTRVAARKAYDMALVDTSRKEAWEAIAIRAFKQAVYIKSLNPYFNTPDIIQQMIDIVGAGISTNLAFQVLSLFGIRVTAKLPISSMIATANEKELLLLASNQLTGGVLLDKDLQALFNKCTTPEQISLLIQRSDLNDKYRELLLNKQDLSAEQVLWIVESCTTSSVLEKAYAHSKANADTRRVIHRHTAFSSVTILSLLQAKLISAEELLELVQNGHSQVDSRVLKASIKQFHANQNILLAILIHRNADEVIIHDILDTYFNSPESLQQTIKQAGTKINSTLLRILAEKAFDESNNLLASNKADWENCLIELFKYAVSNYASDDMVRFIQKKSLSPKLALRALEVFGSSIIAHVPLAEMINVASDKELLLLIDQRITGPLPSHILTSLCAKCTNATLIDLFLNREDLDEASFLALLKNEELNDTHLTLMLDSNITKNTFEGICAHPKINKNERQLIYRHYLLTPEALLLLLKKKESFDADEILFLLYSNSSALSTEVLEHLSEKYLKSPEIVIAVVNHLKATPKIIETALNSEFSTPELFMNMLSEEQMDISLSLLKEMLKISLKRCTNSNHYFDASGWEDAFLRTLKLAKELNVVADVVSLIAPKESIRASLGLRILSTLGSVVTNQLPLKKMISTAVSTELKIFLEIDILNQLDDEVALALLKKCTTEKFITLFLNKTHLSDELLLNIVHRPHLTENHLLQLLRQPHISDALLELIYTRMDATEAVRDAVCRHSAFSSGNLLSLLNDRLIPETRFVYLLQTNNHSFNEPIFNQAIQHFAQHPQVLHAIACHEELTSIAQLNDVTEKAFHLYETHTNPDHTPFIEDCIITSCTKLKKYNAEEPVKALIKKNHAHISSQLGLKVLQTFGETMIGSLPVTAMAQSATTIDDINMLIKLKKLSEGQLKLLARKDLDTTQITALLARKEMTSSIADVLFAKTAYDGKIKNWDWLTEKQLVKVLHQTSDYDSFTIALKHPKLSTQGRNNCLQNIKELYERDHRQAMRSKDPQLKLSSAIEKLKIKAFSHAIKAKGDKHYSDAAKTAFELYQELVKEKEQMFTKQQPKLDHFLTAINTSKPVLEVHRGYKQILLDILNAVLTCVTIGIKAYTTGDWRFFKSNTDSMNVVNEIKDSISDLKQANPQYPQ